MAGNDKKSMPRAYSGSAPYIFVSYAHIDSDRVFPFITALQKKGFNVWFDDGIRFGKEWEDEIADNLLGCSVFLFLVSKRSLESKNCKDELHLAREEGKPFVNVLLEDISDFPSWFKLRYMRYQDCRLFNYSSDEETVEILSQKVVEMALAHTSGEGLEVNKPFVETIQQRASSPAGLQRVHKEEAEKHNRTISNKFEKGAIVEFGSYPQTTDEKAKPIEWLVLDNDGINALLVSKYVLDCKRYHEKYENTTWEKCSLRRWLNDDFLSAAFNNYEQKKILNTNVKAEKNPDYDTDPGNDTIDKIFLLSRQEANNLFKRNEDGMGVPTDYAKKNSAFIDDDHKVGNKATCDWWLRSPGNFQHRALGAFIVLDNLVIYGANGTDVNNSIGVRPALWIKLES